MTRLQKLNRKMLDLEKQGCLTEEQYATYKQLLDAVKALEAIKARHEGVFDHPALVECGPLSVSTAQDMHRLAHNALEGLK